MYKRQAPEENVLYSFKGGQDGAYPEGSLIMDTSGALYGTATEGGTGCSFNGIPGCGTVFKLTPSGPGGTSGRKPCSTASRAVRTGHTPKGA